MANAPFHWYLAAPFIRCESNRWLSGFVPNDDAHFVFRSIPARYQHDRSRKITGLRAWADYFSHAHAVWRAAADDAQPRGIVTCFPQLPLAIGLRKRAARSTLPLVAWTFNLGVLYGGAKRRAAMFGLSAVDRFIVHSRAEIAACSEWLELPATRFEFVPLQRATEPIDFAEDASAPFVLSMGSAHRDYRLLFSVMAELGHPTVVVAAPHAVQGLAIPPNVSVRSGLTGAACDELVQRARVSVVPVANQRTASGQVTLLDAMMYARPVVVTAGPASVDYATHGHDALLVGHGDHAQMKEAIARLWDDAPLRAALGGAARHTAIERFSDQAIGRSLGRVLRDVEAARS
jgi:glycosyltransferase involved in cell wall biosynthesis